MSTDSPAILSQSVLAWLLQATGLLADDRTEPDGRKPRPLRHVSGGTVKTALAGEPIPARWHDLVREGFAVFGREPVPAQLTAIEAGLRDWDQRVSQPAEFIDDGQIVVDVIATDASGEVFQVEMQSWNHAALKERMLYAWATLYKAQLEKGDQYTELRPVVSIWLMDENTFRGATGFHHRFHIRDDEGILELSSHLELHVLELDRWRHHPDLAVPPGLLGWMRFFTEAETWREVPRDIDTPVLESAMSVLTDFQTNAARNDLYRSRLDYLRVQNTMAGELARALAKEAQALASEERALASEAQGAAREARLREKLRAAGIDPDAE